MARTVPAALQTAYDDLDGGLEIVRLYEIGSRYMTDYHDSVTDGAKTYVAENVTLKLLRERPIETECKIWVEMPSDSAWTEGETVVVKEATIDLDAEVDDSLELFTGQVDLIEEKRSVYEIHCIPSLPLDRRATPKYSASCICTFGSARCGYDGDRLYNGANPELCRKTTFDCERMIGAAAFTSGGGAQDDVTSSGDYAPATYARTIYYRVTILTTPGGSDTFKIEKDDDSAFGSPATVVASAACSAYLTATAVQDGLSIAFGAATGHVVGDYWTIQCSNREQFFGFPALPIAGQKVTFGDQISTVGGSGFATWDSTFQQEGYRPDDWVDPRFTDHGDHTEVHVPLDRFDDEEPLTTQPIEPTG